MKKYIMTVVLITVCCFISTISFAEKSYTSYIAKNLSPWAKDDISQALQEGLIQDETLLENLQDFITREEFCEAVITLYEKVSYNILNDDLNNPFSDTDNTTIIKAYHLKIINGRGNGTFGPNLPIRRQEMAIMIHKLIQALSIPYEAPKKPLNVQDEKDIAPWSIDAVRFVNHYNFMTGDGKNFNPKREITIEESIVILNRVYKDALLKIPNSAVEKNYHEELARQIIQLTNEERKKEGLKSLKTHTSLKVMAIDKAKDMVDYNYFSHISPNYGSAFEMMKSYGINYKIAGENIAFGQSSAQEVMTGWMNSSGHRANILNDNFSHIAIGIAENQERHLYFVQLFLTPLD